MSFPVERNEHLAGSAVTVTGAAHGAISSRAACPARQPTANARSRFRLDARKLQAAERYDADGGAGAVRWFDYAAVLASIGFQMLLCRVSGITNRATTKHTAGTAIG
jgi:hypothetical protein